MRFRIILSLFIAAMILQLAGCSKDEENTIAMGRYLEEKLDFPKVNAYETVITGLGIGRDNQLELFEVSSSSIRYTRNEDGTWNKEPVEWLNELVGDRNVTEALIAHGLDGKEYAMIACRDDEGDSRASLYRLEADGTAHQIKISKFDDYDENGNWKDYYIPRNMYVLDDGRVLIGYLNGAVLYNQGGEILVEYVTESGCSLTVSGKKVYILNIDMNQVLVYDIESGEKLSSIDVTNKGYTWANRSLIKMFTGQEGEIYLQNKDGIHKLSEGGSLWETVVDGTLNSMASPNVFMQMAYQDRDGSFYLVSSYDIYDIYRYTYHPDVPTIPTTELTIYSLRKNNTIMEAALEFQNKHEDVRVNYQIAMADEEDENEADYIQALNTELLTKNAADIIVLEGLDFYSYMKKGVLEDITDIMEPFIASKDVYEKVIWTYEHEGRIKAVPISMKVPMVLGTKNAVDASATMETLAKYVNEQTDQSVFGDIDRKDLIETLYERYFPEIYEDGRLELDALIRFFEEISIISEKTIGFKDYGISDCLDEFGVLHNVSEFSVGNYWNSCEVSLVMQIASEIDGTWKDFNHQYEPGITIGVNAYGKQKELAKEFVKLLFTDRIQSNWFYEGLPVIRNSVIKNMISQDESSDVVMNYGYTYKGEFSMYEVVEASDEDMEKFRLMLDQLDTPILIDKNIEKKVIEITEQYLDGNMSAYEAAEAVINFTNIYYQE